MILLKVISLLALVAANPILHHGGVILFEVNPAHVNQFQLISASLNSNASLISKVFVLGNRDPLEEVVYANSESQRSDNGTTFSWTWNIKFPSCSRKDYTVTYVEVVMTQTSTNAYVELEEGGYKQNSVKFSVHSNQTRFADCFLRIYAIKNKNDLDLDNCKDCHQITNKTD